MGLYIMIGPCYQLNVDVRGLDEKTIEEVVAGASETIDITAYKHVVSDGYLKFTPKEELFVDGFKELVDRQYEIWGVKNGSKGDIEAVLAKLSETRRMDELIDIADGKKNELLSYSYQKVEDMWHVEYGKWRESRRAWISMIMLYSVGKAYLECFNDLFVGMEKLIKLDCPVPASRFMKVVLLTG